MSRPGPLDIAIVGMSCRFPGAVDLFAYWEHILSGGDAPTDVKLDRYEIGSSLLREAAGVALADAGLSGGVPEGLRVEVFVARGNDLDQDRGVPTGMIFESLAPDWSEPGREAGRVARSRAIPMVEAAGGSALVALDLGAKALIDERADLAMVAGISLGSEGNTPSRPGDASRTGEEVGVVVLKRLGDAEREGDRIYAVLKGVKVSRDGQGVSLAASRLRASHRDDRGSGDTPETVVLVEEEGPAEPVAAGIGGLIKMALALHHRVWPPTRLGDETSSLLAREDGSIAPSRATRPWVQSDPSIPRCATLHAFEVAGRNAQAILEEHPDGDRDDAPGALLRWDCEAILISAADRSALIEVVRSLLAWVEAGPAVALKDLAYTLNTQHEAGPCRLGLVVRSIADLADRLRASLAKLSDPACQSIRDAHGAYFRERGEGPAPRVALLFPGEGSQYPGMLADLCPHFPEVRALFDTSDRIARDSGSAHRPSDHLFHPPTGQDLALWSAEVAVNVVLSAQWGLYQLLSKLGLQADAILGHSSGELLALAAAGVVEVDRTFEDRLGDLGAIFGRLETSGDLPTARLVAVASSREKVNALIDPDDRVEIAMDNCPHQVVLAGEPASVEVVVGRLQAAGMVCEELPFARAYHTPGFAPAMGPIVRFFESMTMSQPQIPLYSCASGGRMPDDPGSIRRLAVDQWTRAVGFRGTVEAMHADGLNVFVDVGARGNLASFVEDTLRGREALAVAANLPRRSGTAQLNHLVASLFARGVNLEVDHLYARRRPTRLDLGASLRPVPKVSHRHYHSAKELASVSGRAGLVLPMTHDRQDQSCPTGERDRRREPFPTVDLASIDETDATLLDFQATMDAFLRAQQEVMDAYLAHKPAAEDEFSFHVSNGRAETTTEDLGGPWSGVLVSLSEGREAVSMLTLDLDGDPVAEHHTLGGRRISAVHPEWRGLPVLPFAVMAEMLAEAAARLVPARRLWGLRDVRAHRWIRYEDEPIALEIRAVVEPDDPDSVRVSIHNRGPLSAMKPVEPAVFEGLVFFGAARVDAPTAPAFVLEHPDVCRFTPESIYGEQWLFHGPALQAVVGIGPIAMGGIEGTLRVLPFDPLLRDGEDSAGLRTDPIILDNFTHLLGGWGLDRLRDDGDVIFPLRLGELIIHGDRPAVGTDVSCRITIRAIERHRVLADADLVRPDGSTWMTIRGWEDWRFHWPGRFRDGFRQPDRTLLGEPLDLPEQGHRARAVWLEPPADMGRPVWRDVLEHVQLGPDERRDYLALPGPDFRRTHRLWGRIAAKEAARRLRLGRGHPPEYPADLIVDRDPLGRPSMRSRREPGSTDLPLISIAHVDGVAVALACDDPSCHPGIDVEPIVDRSATFEATAFLPAERALLGERSGNDRAEWVARLWVAKEAVAKATGLGFLDGPSGVEVVAVKADGSLRVELRGGLAGACPTLAARSIRVVATRRGDFVWAWTLGTEIER